MHSGITGLINITYNLGNSTVIVLDNSITGMTGHQQNPTTGLTLKNQPTPQVSIEKICEAAGVRRVRVVDPNELKELEQVVREELSGSRTILTGLEPADLFAEAFVCASGGNRTLPVSVFSVTDSAVLLLDYRRIISSGPESCAFHDQLVENMLAVMAGKNLMLNRRIGHLSRRTTREKLSVLPVGTGGALRQYGI